MIFFIFSARPPPPASDLPLQDPRLPEPLPRTPSAGHPSCRLVVFFSRTHFRSFSLSLFCGSSRGILVVFQAPGPSNAHVWSSRAARAPHPSGNHPPGRGASAPTFSGFRPLRSSSFYHISYFLFLCFFLIVFFFIFHCFFVFFEKQTFFAFFFFCFFSGWEGRRERGERQTEPSGS